MNTILMSLWSFEGAENARIPFTISGGHSGGGTPLPIPNRAVKPASADGTRRATSRESRTPPDYSQKGRLERPFVVLGPDEPGLLGVALVELPERPGIRAHQAPRRVPHEVLRDVGLGVGARELVCLLAAALHCRQSCPASAARKHGQAARSFSRQSGSRSRNRRTRSPTGGCVTNSFASPSSANGLIV